MRTNAIIHLLDSCFDPRQLRVLLLTQDRFLPVVAEVSWERPGRDVSSQVAEELMRHGLVDDALFDVLLTARPSREQDIEEVRALWAPASPGSILPSDHVICTASEVYPQAPAHVYTVMRDRFVEIAQRMSITGGCEPLYRREGPPGLWSGHLWRHRFGPDDPFVGALVGALTPQWLESGLTSTLHAIWDDANQVALWTWCGIYFNAIETLRVQSDGSGTRVDVTCEYIPRFALAARQGGMLTLLTGVWRGLRKSQPEFLTSNIRSWLTAVGAQMNA